MWGIIVMIKMIDRLANSAEGYAPGVPGFFVRRSYWYRDVRV
jgi:hypothetical protein